MVAIGLIVIATVAEATGQGPAGSLEIKVKVTEPAASSVALGV